MEKNFKNFIITVVNTVDMFEEASANGKPVIDIIGTDVASFADELVRGEDTYFEKQREKLNSSINKKTSWSSGTNFQSISSSATILNNPVMAMNFISVNLFWYFWGMNTVTAFLVLTG